MRVNVNVGVGIYGTTTTILVGVHVIVAKGIDVFTSCIEVGVKIDKGVNVIVDVDI